MRARANEHPLKFGVHLRQKPNFASTAKFWGVIHDVCYGGGGGGICNFLPPWLYPDMYQCTDPASSKYHCTLIVLCSNFHFLSLVWHYMKPGMIIQGKRLVRQSRTTTTFQLQQPHYSASLHVLTRDNPEFACFLVCFTWQSTDSCCDNSSCLCGLFAPSSWHPSGFL